MLREQLPAEGQAERIARAARALRTIDQIAPRFKNIDIETIKSIAEDPDLEYL